MKYKIYELSARSIISFGTKNSGIGYSFNLNQEITEKCKVQTALHKQDNNALFYQIMKMIKPSYTETADGREITDLSDIIFYMNFTGIFDRNNRNEIWKTRQEKAKYLFHYNGITADFGNGEHSYIVFERSGSMSRECKISFIRKDFYNKLSKRIMLDMYIKNCQLSKLYAYNGLMLSSGTRINNIDIEKPHRVIVVDNPVRTLSNIRTITVEETDHSDNFRNYERVEKKMEININCFDGEGLISKEYAKIVDKAFCGDTIHTSFQIRMPYVKGMLHQIDFKDYFKNIGTETITDIFGTVHGVNDVDIILTKSQFKGLGWLQENYMTWDDYFNIFKKYDHALYITNTSKEFPESFTELNYQFLTTLSITNDEFRPNDLPLGWESSPANETREWLTKETETAYYNLTANEEYRKEYFLKALKGKPLFSKEKKHIIANILKKNPRFISEPIYTKQLDEQANKLLKNYSVGRLIVAGDNRFLSGDLLDFLTGFVDYNNMSNKKYKNNIISSTHFNQIQEEYFYAPKSAYTHNDYCTLLRNPHISRNEELQLKATENISSFMKKYLSHLTDVIMVSSHMLAAERLGGADYDGDMIKTISDPILNKCVQRNYGEFNTDQRKNLFNEKSILFIPSVDAKIGKAGDWEDCYEVIKSTFSSRIGQICNAALDRSVIAYSENTSEELKKQYTEEIETLAILIGLEIDSAKSGIKPNLDKYLEENNIKRTVFLKYKNLIEKSPQKLAWYVNVTNSQLEKFFNKNNWEEISSTIERLPYIAKMLKDNTPKISNIHYADKELFKFAQNNDWKTKLDRNILREVKVLIQDYEACLSRIRSCRIPIKEKARKSDIERILYSRGQEIDSDNLYSYFEYLDRETISKLCDLIRTEKWHLMNQTEREKFLIINLPTVSYWHDLLCDFRNGGYRILGDILCDIDDENNSKDRKQYFRDMDSREFTAMMKAFTENYNMSFYRETVSTKCRELLEKIVKPQQAVSYIVAIGKRNLLFDLLIDVLERNILEIRDDK